MAKAPIRVVAALISREGESGAITARQYLVTQRRPEAILPLKWEFPGGKVEPGESDQEALRRELRLRLGADVRVGNLIQQVQHDYRDYSIVLCLYEASIDPDTVLQAVGVSAFLWVTSREFDQLEFAAADEASLARLLGLERAKS